MDTAATEVPASPWRKLQNPAGPVCLANIMSEQLATDLQIKEEERYVKFCNPELNDTNDVFVKSPECDSDLMIAQMLQAQFDKEHDDTLKMTENKFNGTSKISVSYSNYRVPQKSALYDSSSDVEDDIDDKHREWDSFVSSEKAFKEMPRCGYKKDGDDMVTKHDITMSGRRNACRVMNFPPKLQTGDGGGFDMKLSNKVYNSLKVYSMREQSRRTRLHDKSEQATAALSFDPKTRLLLYRLINQEILDGVNGILSTGKESVVLHAFGGLGQGKIVPRECAIKVFKTTLNEFKTRDKYIRDDFRFKDRFSKQNPRKIIHMWAEKEMHNLMRMQRAGICCPDVVILKKHVLVMSFIGDSQKGAHKLKDVIFSYEDLVDAYAQTVDAMKKLYVDAQLVHADLSEYNILWHNQKCWIIDVSQAVERNHPNALEFLFRDCSNISRFFSKKGLHESKSASDLFKDITNINLPKDGASMLCQMQDYERNVELLTHEKSEIDYSFDFCWEQSKKM